MMTAALLGGLPLMLGIGTAWESAGRSALLLWADS
jgi:hypothetical protein